VARHASISRHGEMVAVFSREVQRAIEPVLPSRGCISDNGKAACPRHIAITIVGKVPFFGAWVRSVGDANDYVASCIFGNSARFNAERSASRSAFLARDNRTAV
jgi:hypothetical protein